MQLISREDLKEKLDRGDEFKLVMVLGEWAYRAKHVPGTLNVSSPDQARDLQHPDDDIVAYCLNPACHARGATHHLLVGAGFKKERRYLGGILDREEAGCPLKGDMAD